MKIDTIIGIDPGANGGMVTYTVCGGVESVKMPKSVTDIRDYLQYIKENHCPIAFLEKVGTVPTDLKQGGKIFRMKELERNFNELKTILELLDIPFCMVHPMTWQSTLKLRKKNEEKTERKNRYKEVAQTLYKDVKMTLWNSDATLIMHFGRYVLRNDLNWVKSNLPTKQKDKLL